MFDGLAGTGRVVSSAYFTADRQDLVDFLRPHGYHEVTLDIGCAGGRLGRQLLNAGLTVPATGGRGAAGKHLRHWREFFKTIINQAHEANPRAVVVAWGTQARDASASALGIDWQSPPPRFDWTYHPVAAKSGPHSFTNFWTTPAGKALVMR